MPKKPDLILHIGTEKTGTTTLQHFLSSNKKELDAQGFHVPTIWGDKNQFWLPFLFTDDSNIDPFLHVSHGCATLDQINMRRREIYSHFHRAIKANHDKTWIISSEHLHSRLQSIHEVRRLSNFTKEYFNSIRIILFIRRPIDAALSLWSTALKSGSTWDQLPPPDHPKMQTLCNHKSSFLLWSSVFRQSDIAIVKYDESLKPTLDIISRFCAQSGIQKQWLSQVNVGKKNQSLSARGMAVMLRINGRIPAFIGSQSNMLRRDIYRYAQLASGRPLVAGPEEIESYEAYYHESDEYIRSHFFSSDQNLWSAPNTFLADNYNCHIPVLEEGELELVDILCSIWTESSKDTLKIASSTQRWRDVVKHYQSKRAALRHRLNSVNTDINELFAMTRKGDGSKADAAFLDLLASRRVYSLLARVFRVYLRKRVS